MTALNVILSWFKKGMYPTEAQFSEAWQSFWHKQEAIPPDNITGLSQILSNKADIIVMNNTIAQKLGFGGKININEGFFDVVFTNPLPVGFSWRFLGQPYCYNENGELIAFIITNKTSNGFRVTVVENSIFEYTCVIDETYSDL